MKAIRETESTSGTVDEITDTLAIQVPEKHLFKDG
jgi:hypothetical protein